MTNKVISIERKYWVIDLQNLIGGTDRIYTSQYPCKQIQAVWNSLKPAISPDDQVLIATGPKTAAHAIFTLRDERLRYLIRRGIDGPETALLDFVDEGFVARRFDSLVIASGHHKLAPLAYRARLLGMTRIWNVWSQDGGNPSRLLHDACTLHAQLNTKSNRAGVTAAGPTQLVA